MFQLLDIAQRERVRSARVDLPYDEIAGALRDARQGVELNSCPSFRRLRLLLHRLSDQKPVEHAEPNQCLRSFIDVACTFQRHVEEFGIVVPEILKNVRHAYLRTQVIELSGHSFAGVFGNARK